MNDQDFEIVSIQPADPPPDLAGTGWCRYVIEQGDNRIRGFQQGNLKAVTLAVEEIVARLNERRYGKSGRVQLKMSGSDKKGARK